MRTPLSLLLFLATFLAPGPALQAQEVLYRYNGALIFDQLGYSVGGLGDVDADGRDDFALSTIPLSMPLGSGQSRVDIRSGRDGSLLRVHAGAVPDDHLGQVVQGIGDVDGDGSADYLISAPFADGAAVLCGVVTVYSGASGSPLYQVSGEATGDDFGIAAAATGDVDGDGSGDFLVGARFNDASGADAGAAYLYSGRTGALLRRVLGDSPGDAFGTGVGGAGDVDNDGRPDFLVGAIGDDNTYYAAGSARLFSGSTGAVLATLNGRGLGEQFGWVLGGMGDLTGDGRAEFFVAAPGARDTGAQAGRVDIYSGRSYAPLIRYYGEHALDTFGYAAANAGDCNGDGLDDLAAGAFQNSNGAASGGNVRVHSGADGSLLLSVDGTGQGDRLGFAVDGAGDVDGDGLDDVLIGTPLADLTGTNSGSATVYTHCPPMLSIAMLTPGQAGVINELAIRCGRPGHVVYAYFSLNRGHVAVSGCPGLFFNLNRPRSLGNAVLDGTGAATLPISVAPGASGRTVLFQALDPLSCELSSLFVQVFP